VLISLSLAALRLIEDCGVALYCDMHAHSRKHNIFIYGCENMKRHPDRRLLEQVFPLMLHKNVADKFSFENCKFRVQKNKEGTGRIVVWVLGVTNSYTLEASFAGSTLRRLKTLSFASRSMTGLRASRSGVLRNPHGLLRR
jgi:cytosolic carboxypeptidase protein 2/3